MLRKDGNCHISKQNNKILESITEYNGYYLQNMLYYIQNHHIRLKTLNDWIKDESLVLLVMYSIEITVV